VSWLALRATERLEDVVTRKQHEQVIGITMTNDLFEHRSEEAKHPQICEPMSTTIYVTTATTMYEKRTSLQALEHIIHSVQDGTYDNIIRNIRATTDDDKRKQLKRDCLPVFYPSIRLSVDGKVDDDSDPTGIIQFDIDKNDNLNLDFALLKHEVMQHSACCYAFQSPSGGLKFGMVTDFIRAPDETTDTMKYRFKVAYKLCLQHIWQHCTVPFAADDSSNKIRQSCFLSHDPQAFFRDDCTAVHINDQCHINPVMLAGSSMDASADEAEVRLALDQIPRTLPYGDRTKVNLCVLSMLGRAGIPVLMVHWQKDDKVTLLQQLEDCFKGAQYGSIGQLWKCAEEHGYKPPTGKKRWTLQPEPCDFALAPLATPEQATAALQSIVRDFVHNKQSQFVNVTAGAGKTRTVLEALSREIRHTDKVLFLVPTHQLAAEIVEAYNEIRRRDIANTNNLRGKIQRGTVIALQGKEKLCENRNAYEVFKQAKVSMPPIYCSNDCQMRGDCLYTAQFDNPWANIRVMTHQEWTNEQAAWFNGRKEYKDGFEPRKNRFGWSPDFIIIDENIFTMSKPLHEPASSRFSSISLIINSVRSGNALKDAIWAHRQQVLQDGAQNSRPKKPAFKSVEDYVRACNRNSQQQAYSAVLAQLVDYCLFDDENLLDGLWIEDDRINWLEMRSAAARYTGIPTLYLDATASKNVVQRLLPGVHFHQVAVRQRSGVRLLQLADTTLTKKFLTDPEKLGNVIDGLKAIVQQYQRVGLITYKSIGTDEEFDATLAEAIGADCWNHFGNLRGMNNFEEVDCLLVVGRYSLPPAVSANYARVIFGHHAEWSPTYADLPVRMKDGRTFKLNTSVADNEFHQAIYEHFSLSETLQAIGRGRPVHGSKKDIYVFSNENLTTNTEITEFFPYERYFDRPEKPVKRQTPLITPDVLEVVKRRGFVQNKESFLKEDLALKKSQVKEKRQQIEEELIAAGAAKMDLLVRYRKGSEKQRPYFIFGDTMKLEQALLEKGERLIVT
jgi:hypothetical protein